MTTAELREKIVERDFLLDQLGELIEQITECTENLASLIETESLVDEADVRKTFVIEETNEGAQLLKEIIEELDGWIEQLIEPWEREQ